MLTTLAILVVHVALFRHFNCSVLLLLCYFLLLYNYAVVCLVKKLKQKGRRELHN